MVVARTSKSWDTCAALSSDGRDDVASLEPPLSPASAPAHDAPFCWHISSMIDCSCGMAGRRCDVTFGGVSRRSLRRMSSRIEA